MSWKKFFRSANLPTSTTNPVSQGGMAGTSAKYSSYLPEVYAGHPNRIQRYYQYDDMDRDSDINAALDTIADFCTQSEEQSDQPFEIKYNGKVTETEVKLINEYIEKWIKLNTFRQKLWQMFRNTIKNGDQLFLRDPETLEWLWVDSFMVEMVKVDDSGSKKPEEYVIRGLDLNRQAKFATITADPQQYRTPFGAANAYGGRPAVVPASSGPVAFSLAGSNADPRGRQAAQTMQNQMFVVDAKHMVHLSLSVGMDINFPFGQSVLEPIFKTFKQKELLEDAILIYRVQRAPERRVFYIDVGAMPPVKAKAHLETVKNEIHSRYIPNRSGGGNSRLDASYNAMSMVEDYFFACLSLNTKIDLLDGRKLSLNDLIEEYKNGKENWIYSLNTKTHEMEPGKISWAGITRKNAEILRVTLDNGEYIDCTPDHKFILRDGSELEAEKLVTGQSLMPLYLFQFNSGKNQKKKQYVRYLCNKTNKKKFVHEISKKPIDKNIVCHHKNLNSMDNTPSNLEIMDAQEHIELHKKLGSYSLGVSWKDPVKRQNLLNGMRNLYDNMSDEDKVKLAERNRQSNIRAWQNFDDEKRKKSVNHINKIREQSNKERTLQYSENMFKRLVELYDNGYDSISKLIPVLKNDEIFQFEFKKANENTKTYKHNTKIGSYIGDKTLNKTVEIAGYNSWDEFKKSYKKNHKVVSVELLPYIEDTGDLTIESESNSHVFALSSGVYVHNCGNEGRGSKVDVLPGGECLSLDTMIPLLDGRNLSLSEIIKEHENGKQLWAYSCDPITGKIVPGMINWAGITRKNAEVLKITLDNGETITVTPDHNFPVQGKGKTEARNIQIGDSLFPFETKKQEIKKGRTKDYMMVFDNQSKKWLYVHRLVAKYFKNSDMENIMINDEKYRDEPRTCVHHKNFNRFDNNPSNLYWMNYKDHYEYHSKTINENFKDNIREGVMNYWKNLSDEERIDIAEKTSLRSKEAWNKKSEQEKLEFWESRRESFLNGRIDKHIERFMSDKEYHDELVARRTEGVKKSYTPERRERYSDLFKERIKTEAFVNQAKNQKLMFDDEIFTKIISLCDKKTLTMEQLIEKANKNKEIMDLIIEQNKNTTAKNLDINNFVLYQRHFRQMLEERNLSWGEVRYKDLQNSKTFNFNIDMMRILIKELKNGANTMNSMISSLNKNKEFIDLLKKENPKTHHLTNNDKIHSNQIITIINEYGFTNWKHFKKNSSNFNHQVVSIEYLDERIDTGTITIDGLEIFHDFHTFALCAGVFTYNSTGEITDLSWFSKKLARGLRIPPSYLSIGDDAAGAISFNDGKLGAALIQEFRFNKYCMRLQNLLSPVFDKEFKYYLEKNGIEIDSSIFELRFNPPQNFTKYRQIEIDTQQMQVYTQVQDNKRLSERFKLKRFLNLSENELIENETLWQEENPELVENSTGENPADSNTNQDLSDVGVRGTSNDFGLDALGNEPEDNTDGNVVGGEQPPEAGPGGSTSSTEAPPPPAPGTPGT
jgi:intein/homing endonuclease